MSIETNNILNKIASKAGWQYGLVKKQSIKQPTNSKFSFQYYIAQNAFNKSSLDLDAIYFTDISPVIYIKQLNNYNPAEIIKLQKRFWNECRAPLTLIITPQIIKILDNYAEPVEINNISKIEYDKFEATTEKELERLADLLQQSKLDSELVFGNTIKLKTDQRVDKRLIGQLRATREQLHDRFKLDFGTIHDLLGRSLFTLYLEQREILTKTDIEKETLVSDNFFDLLQNHPKETYTLFEFLKEKFNGDLFPISKKEKLIVEKNPQILQLIYNCFTGKEDINTKQTSLFNLFDFKYIPIELISAIYEEFMGEEDVKKNIIISKQGKGKKELGAYYTPQMLVEFVYNEVLPMPSKNDCKYNIKILDPACGSGIFLVEGFKRIIERWKYAHKQTELSEATLTELLFNNIYGIEIHPEAIKITAFSLYLTFIQNMNPREILRKVRFQPLILWTKPEEVEQRDPKTFGLNLLQANTFIREEKGFKENPNDKVNAFFNTRFELVAGNPPWKSGNVDVEIKSWAKQEGWDLERDIIKGFLSYVPLIAPEATIALIASAKVLFNTSGTDEKFRNRFFSENKVSVIANFAVVRNVLFEKAKQAAALIIYNQRNTKEIDPTESIIYCVPKTSSSIQNRNTITIDASEIKYLPIHEVLKPNSKIFKIAMYGNIRDLKFINKLNRIKSIDEQNVLQGMGLIKDKDAKNKGNTRLGENYFIDASDILPYYTPSTKTKLKNHIDYLLHRTDGRDLYSAPLLLFKEGTKFGELCCSYVDYDCVFLSASKGMKFINKDTNFHKAFIACLNSSLATYYYISICSNWGVSKGGQIQKNEVSLFPAIPYNLEEHAINGLAEKVDEIIAIYKSNDFSDLLVKEKIKPIKEKIDSIIYRELKISKTEQTLIENTLNYSNVIKENYVLSRAEKPAIVKIDIIQYVQTYLEVVNKHFNGSTIKLTAEIFTNSTTKDELVCVKFVFGERSSMYKSIEESTKDISKLLKEINNFVFKEYSTSIYYRRFIKYDLKNAFYLIKPNQKRFWSKASALNDADNLIVEILNQSRD